MKSIDLAMGLSGAVVAIGAAVVMGVGVAGCGLPIAGSLAISAQVTLAYFACMYLYIEETS